MIERRGKRKGGGFVMLTILWIMTITAIVAMGAALVARHGVAEGASRVWLERARWQALGCERRVVAAIDGILADALASNEVVAAWRTLPRHLATASPLSDCDVRLEAAGTRLDVNAASAEMLTNLFDAMGLEAESAGLVDAVEDWIDSDDEPRPNGAEREWYERAGSYPPSNDSLADLRQLERVRGFEQLRGLDSILSTEPGRVSLATAPVTVLMAVPGITRETAEQIVALQQAGTPVAELLEITPRISTASASALQARYADAVRVTTPDPDAWLVRVRVARGSPAVAVQLEWRVVRAGSRCAVAGTRSRI